MPQRWIAGWDVEVLRVWMCARVIADQMKVVSTRRGDAEGLLQQAIRLVTITIGAVFMWRHLEIGVTASGALGRFAGS